MGYYLFLLALAACGCIFSLKTNAIKAIMQITDTISKTVKIAIAITLMLLLLSMLLSVVLLFSANGCDDLTEMLV